MDIKTIQPQGGERLTYSVIETARLLGVSKQAVYRAAKEGRLPSVKLGDRVLVPRLALEQYLLANRAVWLH